MQEEKIDLELGDGQLLERGKRGMADAEIIQRDADAERAEPRDALALPSEIVQDTPRELDMLVNGTDAGLEQIRSGLAWHYKRYEREQSTEDRVAYARAEETVRAERRGLWRDPKPVPPWNFRKH